MNKINNNSKTITQYAGFLRRFSASIIDGAVLILLEVGLSLSLGTNPFTTEAKLYTESLDKVLTLVLSIGYSLLFWVNFEGATPGKRILGIKIVKEDDKKLDYTTGLLRYIGYWISTVPLLLGFLWMLWDKKKQTWHDKFAKTVVVKTEKKINKFLIAIFVILAFIATSGISIIPSLYKDKTLKKSKEQYKKVTKKYSEEVKKLNEKTSMLLKSASAKIRKANKLAGKMDISSNEKEQVKILIAEAIKEAKEASELEPDNPVSWIQLGNIYSNLIGVADGADIWAIKAYQKAINLDSDNYLYHEKLGGVYFRIGKYEDAISEFLKVIELSPSYANGYYNLGVAYKEYGAKSKAKKALEKALDFLPDNDPDRYKVEKELEAF